MHGHRQYILGLAKRASFNYSLGFFFLLLLVLLRFGQTSSDCYDKYGDSVIAIGDMLAALIQGGCCWTSQFRAGGLRLWFKRIIEPLPATVSYPRQP